MQKDSPRSAEGLSGSTCQARCRSGRPMSLGELIDRVTLLYARPSTGRLDYYGRTAAVIGNSHETNDLVVAAGGAATGNPPTSCVSGRRGRVGVGRLVRHAGAWAHEDGRLSSLCSSTRRSRKRGELLVHLIRSACRRSRPRPATHPCSPASRCARRNLRPVTAAGPLVARNRSAR